MLGSSVFKSGVFKEAPFFYSSLSLDGRGIEGEGEQIKFFPFRKRLPALGWERVASRPGEANQAEYFTPSSGGYAVCKAP